MHVIYSYSGNRHRSSAQSSRVRWSASWVRLAVMVALMAASFTFGTLLHAFASWDGGYAGNSGGTADAAATGSALDSSSRTTVVVQPGDTLWSIALEHKPDRKDTRAYVHGIRKANNLDGNSVLQIGDVLVMP